MCPLEESTATGGHCPLCILWWPNPREKVNEVGGESNLKPEALEGNVLPICMDK